MSSFEIRPIEDEAVSHQAAALQEAFWPVTDPRYTSPNLMLQAARHGGLYLGAFEGPRLIGLLFGALGLIPGGNRIDLVAAARLKIYLRSVLVAPACQNHGVGYALLVQARDYAIRLGIHLITWAFDPLSSAQSWLFIGKSGGIVHTHETAGHDLSPYLALEWWVNNNRVKRRTTRPRQPLTLTAFLDGGGVVANATSVNAAHHAVPPGEFIDHPHNVVLVEIPSNFGYIQADDPELAQRWRAHIHQTLAHYFHKGYLITDFVRHVNDILPERDFYILTYRDA